MKKKAISLAVCIAMILSAMTFSVSADAGEAKTLLKDDFTYSAGSISNSSWTKFDGTNNGQGIVSKAGVNVINFEYKVGAIRKLDTAIDLDSENVYYASWVQSMNEIPMSGSQTLKTGFVNINSGAEYNKARTILLWQGQAGKEYPTVKLALGSGFSGDLSSNDNKIKPGILYNVLMRIETHKDSNDVIQVKYWQCDSAEPLGWNGGEKRESVSGKREYFEIYTGNVQAYFGNLNVEVYSGDKATAADKIISDAKAYVSATAGTEPNVDENTNVISGGVVYNSAKNIITLKNNTYVKDIVVIDTNNNYAIVSSIKAAGSYSFVAKIANDSNAVISDRKYFAAAASYDKYGAMQRVKLCLVDSADANGGLAKTTGLLFDNITAAEAAGYIRLYIWDADTLKPIINGVTVDGAKMINY